MTEFLNGHYYSLNQYLRETFGCKVYKISLNGGFSCPNRDGSLDTRGCIFCSSGGSGEFSENASLTIEQQIESAKQRLKNKINGQDCKYIAYFQSFTNTYAPVSYLRKIFTQAIFHNDIVGISIGTRPDCLPDDVLELLKELNQIKPVWVELGLQTIHEQTARYIRRCYDLSVFDNAVKKLRLLGIHTVVHLILGLPNESRNMILQSVQYVCRSGIDGIKLQLLHVLKNTDLACDYLNGQFSVFTQEEYIDLICDCIAVIPEQVVIHRITGDGDKKILIAPLWSGNKKAVLNAMNKAFSQRNVIQGRNACQT